MKKNRPSVSGLLLRRCLQAFLLVAATAAVLFLFRSFLNRTVLALCFLLPVGWSAFRWGPAPGACAALAAILAADLLLLPSEAGWAPDVLAPWSVLALVLLVANWAYYRMQAGLERNPALVYREYCAPLIRELHDELGRLQSTEGILYTLADYFQASFQAHQAEVRIRPENASPRITVAQPEGDGNGRAAGEPDRVLPITTVAGLSGEICLWRGQSWLPPQDSYLFQFLTEQAAQALERVRPDWAEAGRPASVPKLEQPFKSPVRVVLPDSAGLVPTSLR